MFPTVGALVDVEVARLPLCTTLFLLSFGFPDCVFVPPLGDDSVSNLAIYIRRQRFSCHMRCPLRGTLCAFCIADFRSGIPVQLASQEENEMGGITN